jgi:hypothetical protein
MYEVLPWEKNKLEIFFLHRSSAGEIGIRSAGTLTTVSQLHTLFAFDSYAHKKPRPNKIWVVFRISEMLFNCFPTYDFNILFSYTNP